MSIQNDYTKKNLGNKSKHSINIVKKWGIQGEVCHLEVANRIRKIPSVIY